MSIGKEYQARYEHYYGDNAISKKRSVVARQSVNHIQAITQGQTYGSVLDIGAGEGAVLAELHARRFSRTLAAVEISGSGIEAINSRAISCLKSVDRFDGYTIPHSDDAFDLGVTNHVLEHVEHERMFLAEAARVCRTLYVEVPLEHLGDLSKSIRMSGPYGHINFYTRWSFENLLRTAGLDILRLTVFPHDLEVEQFGSGRVKGAAKYFLRQTLLRAAPRFAMNRLVYMAGALCTKSS